MKSDEFAKTFCQFYSKLDSSHTVIIKKLLYVYFMFILKLENKLKRKEAMRLVSLSICKKMKKKQEALQFLIDSYMTQIKKLEQEVKELKERNDFNRKYTWDMVKNPVIKYFPYISLLLIIYYLTKYSDNFKKYGSI